MKLPSKITSYGESTLSKLPPILSVLQNADIGVFGLARYCPAGPGTDSQPPGAGIYDGGGGSRHPGKPPDLPAFDPQRDPPTGGHLHCSLRLSHSDRGHLVLPGAGGEIPLCVLGQYYE